MLVLLQAFEEIGNVEESVAVEPYVNEGRLHPGQHARDAAPVDAAGQAKFFFPFKINFNDLTFFHQSDFGLVGRGGDYHFLRHGESFRGSRPGAGKCAARKRG